MRDITSSGRKVSWVPSENALRARDESSSDGLESGLSSAGTALPRLPHAVNTPSGYAVPPDLAFLFGPGEEPWAPLPTVVARPGDEWETTQSEFHTDLVVAADEALLLSGRYSGLRQTANFSDFTNDGVLWLETELLLGTAVTGALGTFINNGDIVILSIDGGVGGVGIATGDFIYAGNQSEVQNHGNIIAVSVNGDATGLGINSYWGEIVGHPPVTHVNSGVIDAWSGFAAWGVNMVNGGLLENSGTIRATGPVQAIGIFTQNFYPYQTSTITNSGLIEAVGGASNEIGVLFYWTGGYSLINSGTIRAATAVLSEIRDDHNGVSIINTATGMIDGNIILGGNRTDDFMGATDTLVNDGLIIGNVWLGHHGDRFTQLLGRLEGRLDLGGGDDIALTNLGSDIIFGGDGRDEIRSGVDDDTLNGGRGADILDGGSGQDLADYSDSELGVSVNLATGSGAGGAASGDTLIDIEDVSGSAYRDTLTGSLVANHLSGNDGDDVLEGGGGEDTLDGGAGADTAVFSGNQSDYLITTNPDGSRTVSDLRSGSPDGTDQLIDIEFLRFADISTGEPDAAPALTTIADVLAADGITPWMPLPEFSRPEGYVETDWQYYTYVADDFVVEEGEAYMGIGLNVLLRAYRPANLTNNGLLWAEGTTINVYTVRGNFGELTNNGDMIAISTRDTIWTVHGADSLQNYGNIIGVSGTGDATGYITYGNVGPALSANFGLIGVWSNGTAIGVQLMNGHGFNNSGTILANGSREATAIASGRDMQLENSGLIEANSVGGNSIGIDLWGTGAYLEFGNSGTLRADTAIFADLDYIQPLSVHNRLDGLIVGDIIVSGTIDTIINDGQLIGDIALNDRDDTFVQLTGHLDGTLDLGEGDDVAHMNFGNDTVIGGAGDDEIRTGVDDDILVGGAGADILDGGDGTDGADYADSASRVEIDLNLSTAAGGDAEGDSLIGIENLIGSIYGDTLTGDAADNVLTGGAGADALNGGGGSDSANYSTSAAGVLIDLALGTGFGGDAEGDILTSIENLMGSNFDDQLTGDSGDNNLAGGAGADLLDGGAGQDLADYRGSAEGVHVNLDTGTTEGGDAGGDVLTDIEGLLGSEFDDILTGSGAANTLVGYGGNDMLRGGDDDDQLYGDAGDDRLYGDAGDDRLYGGAGADRLYGGAGTDVFRAGDDDDVLKGDDGDDLLYGEDGNDQLSGDAGNDRLYGGAGADELFGGDGVDVLKGGYDADVLYGDAGNDKLYGEYGNDTLYGGTGIDQLFGGTGNDQLYGDAGNDRLYGDAGADLLYGGDDADVLRGGDDDDVLSGGNGADRLLGESGNDQLSGDAGDDRLYGGVGADELHGGDDADVLKGGDDDDVLYGESGNDKLFGDAGNDTLYGGTEVDQLFGGDGSDTLYGDVGSDRLYGDAGTDLLYGGDGADTLRGGDDADTLSGDSGSDRLYGDAGADQLYGGDGADTLYGGDDGDVLRGGDGADVLKGGSDADVLHGENGNDKLYGDAGEDRLYGGAGIDQLFGGDGSDVLKGGDDGDRLYGEDGNDKLYGDAGEDRLYGGAGIDQLFGGDGSDVLKGGDDGDRLYGEDGNDKLYGDAGNDLIDGGAGLDTAYFAGDFADYTLTLLGSGAVRIVGPDGTDTLTDIERLHFDDQLVNLDSVWAPIAEGAILNHTWSNGSGGPSQDDRDAGKPGDTPVMDGLSHDFDDGLLQIDRAGWTGLVDRGAVGWDDRGWLTLGEGGNPAAETRASLTVSGEIPASPDWSLTDGAPDTSGATSRFLDLVERHDLGGEMRVAAEHGAFDDRGGPAGHLFMFDPIDSFASFNASLPVKDVSGFDMISENGPAHASLKMAHLAATVTPVDRSVELIDVSMDGGPIALDTAEWWQV